MPFYRKIFLFTGFILCQKMRMLGLVQPIENMNIICITIKIRLRKKEVFILEEV